jgi:hypothetical protein
MADTLKVACPKCKTVMQLGADKRGTKVKCPKCAAVIAIPGAPAKAAAQATAPAKAAAGEGLEEEVPTLKKAGQEDEWGIIESYEVKRTKDKQRCPHCAHDLDDDQQVCLNCGYDLIKRDRHGSRVLHGTTSLDYFIWWLPGIICAFCALGCGVMIYMVLSGTPDFGSLNWMQRKGVPGEAKWGYMYSTVLFAFIGFFFGRFAVKRLVMKPHPPEQEKYLHKEDEDDED